MTTDENLISFRDIADQAKPHPMLEDIQTWLQTPVTPAQAGPIVVMGALLLVIVALSVNARIPRRNDKTTKPEHSRSLIARAFGGLNATPFESVVFFAISIAFAVLFFLALIAAFVTIVATIRSVTNDLSDGVSLGLGALLVALLGAPFLIWRTLVAQRTLEATQRQTELQDEDKRLREEAQFNDKINAAATDLAARRQVTRVAIDPNGDIVRDKEGKETILTEWQDDLVTRAAAIDRLEGLAQEAIEREDYPPAQRIARMLSIYVQELSREYPAEPAPAFESRDQMQDWARTLRPVLRPDMERAAQSLGRINPMDERKRERFDPRNIDLRRCNPQGFDLQRLNLSRILLDDACMQGANFLGASLRAARLYNAQAEGANLRQADIEWAKFPWANLQAADLIGTTISNANMTMADLREAHISGRASVANLYQTNLRGAVLRARFKDAQMGGAQMQEADLTGVRFAGISKIATVSLRGAAIGSTDNTTIAQLRPFWPEIFADGTLRPHVPEADWPSHWPREELAYNSDDPKNSPFHIAWRAWQATLPPEPTE